MSTSPLLSLPAPAPGPRPSISAPDRRRLLSAAVLLPAWRALPVPFKSGAEAAGAVAGGHVAATSEASIVALPHLKEGGKFRALATTWLRRMTVAPELPTAIEQGYPQVRIAHWAGLHAPAGVPAGILDRMASAVDAAMRSRDIVDRLVPMGIEPVGGSRAAFQDFTVAERARLAEVVKAAGMRED